ncbi:MAG TPA: NUDIX domain-containing protein [Solirubrobacteraceae bacterium]|jgi:ADP-ribose pyrophosphatase YjhB (NUDIX family)|nr:NUDIX domain-containing protein [Solirubrobacteraceae bacterium]
MPSLNPALEDVRFCPRCAQPARIEFPRSLQCSACGYAALFGPDPVAAAIPRDADGRIWLLRRTLHEGAGLWSFPGGYVELGESVEEAARRETREEMVIDIALGDLVGVYSREDTRAVLVVFAARALGTPRETAEASEVRAFTPSELPWDELAFWSTRQALRDLLA